VVRAVLFLVLAGALFAADEIPGWVRDAAAAKAPAYPAKTPAVVLFQEETLTVDSAGNRVMTERAVIRKLADGRVPLRASRTFNVKSGRIREFHAWTISTGGKETRYGKDRVVEREVDGGDLFDEVRVKLVAPGDDWQAGGVFAYEIVEEEKTLFTQYPYTFQFNLPVLLSRFVLTLPSGWDAKGHIFNQPASGPGYSNSGTVHTWEQRNLPWIESEDHSPEWHLLTPQLAVTYFPASTATGLRPLKDWASVSGWMASLADPQTKVTPAIQAKADQLTAGIVAPLDKIRAIAAFVQQTNYISVQLNITRGGGYTPHRAEDILAKNYGDCKDKSTLMKSLLAAAGIDSHLVSIFSGARDFVRPEWPSTMQFNHMILAIRPPDGVELPTVATHPSLGRLLFFDPTDALTPVGDLPEDEQGSYALVIAGDRGDLVRVPRAPIAANRIASVTTAVLDANSSIQAKTRRQYFGQSASQLRYALKNQDESAFRKRFESTLTRRLGGLSLTKITPKDSPADNRLDLDLEFSTLEFGKIMQNRLWILTPGALLSGGSYFLPAAPERKLPVKLEALMREDRIAIQIPAGFQPDEIPDPVVIQNGYGEFRATWKAEAGKVEMEQTLRVNDIDAPAADHAKVRDFFDRVIAAANASVVLIKK